MQKILSVAGTLPSEARPVQDLIRLEQVRTLHANLPLSQSVALANAAVLAALQAMVIESARVSIWLTIVVAVTLGRLYLGVRFSRSAANDGDAERWLAWFGAGAVAAGVAWGSAAWLLYPPDSVVYQVFLAFVLAGMVAGAVSLLTPVFWIYALFALCSLSPAILRFLWAGDAIHYAMGGMGGLFLLAMLATGKRVHDMIAQSLALRFENRELVVELSSARQNLEAANADLLATQRTLRTANEELERRVAERTSALESADRNKDEFLAMLSHELRNPLAAIATSSHLLRQPDLPSAHAERARQVIDRQARYLARLVDDLLDVTRIARGKTMLRRERVDLTDCLQRAADDCGSLFEELGVHLSVEVPASSVWAAVDPTRIAQLIGNLLQNAAKFTPAGGQVKLSLQASDEWAEIRVSDNGVGIDPAFLPRLFEPFMQGPRTTARSEGGLGLGLALVKGIAELHQGTAHGESNGAGQGATFTVRLPLAAAEVATETVRPVPPPTAQSRSVLVVDDNRDAADSLALLIEAFGHSAQVAYDGPSAIEKAHRNPPDVVLCDLGLPGMNGYELARRLRAGRKDLRIIAVTGYTRPQDRAEATAAGFDGFVTKPPQPETIRQWLC